MNRVYVRGRLRAPWALLQHKYRMMPCIYFDISPINQFSTSLLTMSKQNGPKYVIDTIIGGTASYDDIVGPGAPQSDAPRQRVWPAIPQEYRPPPPAIENAVKEGVVID